MKYLFLTNDGLEAPPELVLEPFNASVDKNDYEVRIISRLELDGAHTPRVS